MAFELTDQQKAILDWVDTSKSGDCLVVDALAGTGKSSSLEATILHAANSGLSNMLYCAYNKSIASEFSQRLSRVGVDFKTCNASTMHSAGFQAWKRVHRGVRIDGQKCRGIWRKAVENREKPRERELMKESEGFVLKLVSLAKQRVAAPGVEIIDHFGLEEDMPDGVTVDQLIRWSTAVFDISSRQCDKIVDFDDMIYAPVQLPCRVWEYDLVMVDEAQDLNESRRQLAYKMLSPKGRMIIVGDPNQAIYGFSGADADSMDRMADMFA